MMATRSRTPAGEARGGGPSRAHPADLRVLARGGALNAIGIVVNAVFSFALGVIVARALGAHGAGLVFETLAVFMIFSAVGQLGADTGAVRTVARYLALGHVEQIRALIRIAVWPVALASSVLAVALFALAPQTAALIVHGHDQTASTYLRILAPFLPLAALSTVLLAAARGLGTMLPFVAIERIGRSVLRLLLTVAVVAAGMGGVAIVVVWGIPVALGLVAGAIWLMFLLRRAETGPYAAVDSPPPAASEITREFWSFSAFRGVASLFRIGILWLDVLLVGALSSARDAGVYTAASRLIAVGGFALEAVLLVVGPQISALLARNEHARTQALYQISTAWLTAVAFPFYLTTAAFAPLLLSVFGHEFTSGSTALLILSLAMLLDMATGPVTTVLLMAGKSSWNLANVALTLFVNALLNVILIPSFGIEGAAIAWGVSIFVQNVVPLVQIWRSLRLQPLSASLLVAAVASTVSYGGVGLLVRWLLGPTLSGMVVFLALGSLLYLGLLFRFRRTLVLETLWSSLFRRLSARPLPANP